MWFVSNAFVCWIIQLHSNFFHFYSFFLIIHHFSFVFFFFFLFDFVHFAPLSLEIINEVFPFMFVSIHSIHILPNIGSFFLHIFENMNNWTRTVSYISALLICCLANHFKIDSRAIQIEIHYFFFKYLNTSWIIVVDENRIFVQFLYHWCENSCLMFSILNNNNNFSNI